MHTMVPWQKQKTFEEIANRCIEYVIKEYSRNCVIVFDGYPVEPTTKDHAPEYHSEAAGIAPEVQIDPSSRLDLKKEQSLANNRNKQAFINLLSHSFRNRSVSVRQANDDADLLIATTAIDCAMSADVVVVAQDTDVITLLWHYIDELSGAVYMKTSERVWDIKCLVATGMKDIFLLTHAFLGCDTTSRIYGIRKDKIIESTKLQEVCRDAADIFYSANATKEQVQMEGERLLLNLLNRPTMASLNEARGKIFMEKVDGKQVVKPESLPPNVDEGTLHFYSVPYNSGLARKLTSAHRVGLESQ